MVNRERVAVIDAYSYAWYFTIGVNVSDNTYAK